MNRQEVIEELKDLKKHVVPGERVEFVLDKINIIINSLSEPRFKSDNKADLAFIEELAKNSYPECYKEDEVGEYVDLPMLVLKLQEKFKEQEKKTPEITVNVNHQTTADEVGKALRKVMRDIGRL